MEERSFDAALDDEPLISPTVLHKADYDMFQYERYDWGARGFTSISGPGYRVVLLTRGYFALVSPRKFSKINSHKWYADVRYDKETGRVIEIYAARDIRKNGKKIKVYMHRVLKGAGKAVTVDHRLSRGLDNRDPNLRGTIVQFNNANNASRQSRRVHHNLPRGVEPRGQRYGWQIKYRGVTERSRLTWKDPTVAHHHYLARHRKYFGCHGWNGDGKINSPQFPPLKASLQTPSSFVRGKVIDSSVIPFE